MNTTYFLNTIMGNVFNTKTTPAIPAVYYVGLSTDTPTVDGQCLGEPSFNGTGYLRVELNMLSEPNNGEITNNSVIEFPESISDWGVVTYYVVYDSPTGGNLLFFEALESPRTVEKNTVVIIRNGKLTIKLSNQ